MDNLVYEETINTEISSSEFVDKQWLYVNDNNNSSYSGQVVIDSTALSNCGQYLNWSESFLTFPMVLQVSSAGNLAQNTVADFMVGLKSGYWQIIHSLIVEYNNSNVVQQVPYLNIFNSFKANTSWSDGDIENWGALTGYCPDSADSWIYNNHAFVNTAVGYNTSILSASGSGVCNNRNAPYVDITTLLSVNIPPLDGSTNAGAGCPTIADTVATAPSNYNVKTQATVRKSASRGACYNKGFWRRQTWLVYDPALNPGTDLQNLSSNQTALVAGSGGADPYTNISGYAAIFQSYIQSGNGYRVIIFDAVIRMKDICDLFGKMPMVKGGTMRLYINTNQTYFTATSVPPIYDAADPGAYGNFISHGEVFLTSSPVILGGGGTNPVMVASTDIGQGLAGLSPLEGGGAGAPPSYDFAVGLSIVKTQFPQFPNTQQFTAPITSTRLYCPAYTLAPSAEQRLLALAPTKKIVYNDIFYYTYTNVPPGTFSFLVSNGIPNLRGALLTAFLPKSSNGDATGIVGQVTTDSILSPFTSAPASPDPISITNLNFQISGKNIFISNLLYDYEVFAEQLVSSNQLNGSLTTSLASGQIGFAEFENLYRYYYANISRSIPSEDGVAKAVQVQGINNSPVNVNFIVFLEFERTITIDLRTGARIE